MKELSNLKKSLFISFLILIIQLVGWYFSNSLALLSDSGHVFSDIIALSTSFLAIWIATKKSSSRRTFGFHRLEVFAALFNGILLILMAISIGIEALGRFNSSSEISALPVLFSSIIGLIGNLYVAYKLQHEENLNIRSAFIHAAADALSSIGVILGAIIILFSGLFIVDAIVSLIISVIILFSAYSIIRSSLSILLESVPYEAPVEKVTAILKSINKIKGVHDLHIWRSCSEFTFAMMHVEVEEDSLIETRLLCKEIEEKLLHEFNIVHTTIQFEPFGCSCENQEKCKVVEHKKTHSH